MVAPPFASLERFQQCGAHTTPQPACMHGAAPVSNFTATAGGALATVRTCALSRVYCIVSLVLYRERRVIPRRCTVNPPGDACPCGRGRARAAASGVSGVIFRMSLTFVVSIRSHLSHDRNLELANAHRTCLHLRTCAVASSQTDWLLTRRPDTSSSRPRTSREPSANGFGLARPGARRP